jgi:hypothetical protein
MGKRDVELHALEQENALAYAQRMKIHFARKADHNKLESLGYFILVIVTTLAVSAFVAFGESKLTSKVIPLCLSLIATAASTWLQFRKPHQLWAIYRTAQRYIESHMVKFRFEVDEYSDEKVREKLLAKHVAQIALAAHDLWVPLIPSPEGLERLRPASSAKLVPAPGKEPPEAKLATGDGVAQKAD